MALMVAPAFSVASSSSRSNPSSSNSSGSTMTFPFFGRPRVNNPLGTPFKASRSMSASQAPSKAFVFARTAPFERTDGEALIRVTVPIPDGPAEMTVRERLRIDEEVEDAVVDLDRAGKESGRSKSMSASPSTWCRNENGGFPVKEFRKGEDPCGWLLEVDDLDVFNVVEG